MPLQSLTQLNSAFSLNRAQHLAAQLATEYPNDESAQLSAAFLTTLGRPATDDQLAAARELLNKQREAYRQEKLNVELAWRDLCQMLLASNAFLYIE